MDKPTNKYSKLIFIFPALVLLMLISTAIISYVTVGFDNFFLSLGWLGITAYIILVLVLLILPVAIRNITLAGSIIIGAILVILLSVLSAFMFVAGLAISRIIICKLSDTRDLTEGVAEEMKNFINDGKKTIVIFSTYVDWDTALNSLPADKRKELKNKVITLDKADKISDKLADAKVDGNNVNSLDVMSKKGLKKNCEKRISWRECRAILKIAGGTVVQVPFKRPNHTNTPNFNLNRYTSFPNNEKVSGFASPDNSHKESKDVGLSLSLWNYDNNGQFGRKTQNWNNNWPSYEPWSNNLPNPRQNHFYGQEFSA